MHMHTRYNAYPTYTTSYTAFVYPAHPAGERTAQASAAELEVVLHLYICIWIAPPVRSKSEVVLHLYICIWIAPPVRSE